MTKLMTIYHGRNKMVPGELSSVRETRGPSLVLTVDTQNAGRHLFHVPSTMWLRDRETLLIDMLGKFVIEAHDTLFIDHIRLSVFRDGTYAKALKLNGQKVIEKLCLPKGLTITIQPDRAEQQKLSTYLLECGMPDLNAKPPCTFCGGEGEIKQMWPDGNGGVNRVLIPCPMCRRVG
jgi:hypothetical protein